MKKILFITSFPPEGGAGGGVILRSLFDSYDSKNMQWLILNKDITVNKTWRLDIIRHLPFVHIPGLRFQFIYYAKKYFFNYLLLFFWLFKLFSIKKQFKPDLIWIVIDKDEIFLMYYLVKFSGIQFHLTIHDDPEVSLKLVGKIIKKTDLNRFEYLLKNASTIDCISNKMSNYYFQKAGVNSIVLTRTISRSTLELNSQIDKLNNNEINIILGGWGDCPKPWPNCLIEAVNILEKKSNKKVKFYAFDPKFKDLKDSRFIYCERMTASEFDFFLNKIDIGYAPDPLELKYRLFAQTSLSTKIVTYVSSTLPTFYHGPQDSTVGELFSRFKAGVIVESNDPDTIANGFLDLIINYDLYRSESVQLAINDFDEGVLKERLNLILN
jgi:hypothetical protein